ncbi:MAG: FAD:protein FMN transferase [Holophagales bacterium]|nr:FAD:protein FMN transferase [Holophagales bacterium]
MGACAPVEPEPQVERLLYTFRGSTMGTYYVVKVVRPVEEALDDPAQEDLLGRIEERLEGVNRRMSTYLEESELSRLNAHLSTDPFPLSAATFEVVSAAVELGKLTGGALDPTVGPLVNAYGFGPGVGGEAVARPSPEELAALRQRVGLHLLELDPPGSRVSKLAPELYVDLSSLAKGYAVDQVANTLVAEGFGSIMVEVGGEVRTAGVNLSGGPWRVGIERPADGGGDVQRIVSLQGLAMATSGDYRNYREEQGVRISHIIDPRSGRPVDHRLASVTVVDRTCMRADALATALMVMGPEDGLAWAEEQELAALFLVREGDGFTERATTLFQEQLADT